MTHFTYRVKYQLNITLVSLYLILVFDIQLAVFDINNSMRNIQNTEIAALDRFASIVAINLQKSISMEALEILRGFLCIYEKLGVTKTA